MLLLQRQVKYVEDMIVTIYTERVGLSRNEVIQVISYTGQVYSYVQPESHLYHLIWEKWLPNMKMHGWVIQNQENTTE